jgi:hypothetical protein
MRLTNGKCYTLHNLSNPLGALGVAQMTIVLSILGVVAALAAFLVLSVKINRRTCLRAYGQGIDDIGALSWQKIRERYKTYLSPMRPMDAAAYKRGVEYALLSGKDDRWESMKRDFTQAWASGSITKEGTTIRAIGPKAALELFAPAVPAQLMAAILSNPDQPPILSKVRLENGRT